MSLVIASIIILCISTSFATLLNRTVLDTIFLSIACIVAILFTFGIINEKGCLLIGLYVIVFLVVASITYTDKLQHLPKSTRLQEAHYEIV
jgi:hypothetical protein